MADPIPPPPDQDPAALLEAATRFHEDGDLAHAEAGYEAILAIDPRHFTAIHLLGLLKRQCGQPEAALGLLATALQLNPRSALAQQNMGLILLDLERPEEALVHFRLALVLKPDDRDAHLICATALRELGRHGEALTHLDHALAVHGEFPEALLNRAVVLTDLGRPEEALASLDRALALSPDFPEALLDRGNALRHLQQPEQALACYDQALACRPGFPEALLNRGNVLLHLGRPEPALESFEMCLAQQPGNPAAQLSTGNALVELGRHSEALARFDEALAHRPDFADALYNRGHLLQTLERHQEALRDYDRTLALEPDRSDALINRATVLHRTLRHPEALASLVRVLALQPEHPEALVNTGLILLDLGRAKEALALFERILERHPDHLEALHSRGTALLDLQRPQEALASYALATPTLLTPESLLNRGVALHQMGRHEEAMASYDAALALRPGFAVAHSNRIFLLDYLAELDFARHQDERRQFFLAQTRDLPPPRSDHPNVRDPDRRLVLGYVSADFRHHSAAACFGPVLRRHDRTAFKVICYSGVLAEDDWTQEFRACSDVWRVVPTLSDAALAEQIRQDEVDILIDLSGHSKGNRLLVFARRPAPVQVTAWGHGGGTGLPMVDYQFTDPVMVPPEVRSLFAEAAYDLPCCLTFEAPPFAPAIAGPPCLRSGSITFGSLNRLNKATPAVFRLWARILAAVPGSRLLLKDVALEEVQTREALRATLTGLGVEPERIDLRGYSDRRSHLAVYNEIDIALDTFPQNGGITTWEALWMGTPVITLLGSRPACRISAAILRAVGLGEWVAPDEAGYLELAARLAADPAALRRFREQARERILASPSGDPAAYTRAVETGYRAMWLTWLQRVGGGPDPAILLEEALAFHGRGDLDSAEPRYRAILARDPRHFTATHLLGLLRSQRSDDAGAEPLLREAIRQNPRSPLAHLHLGMALRNQGRIEEALDHFSRSRLLKPDHPETLMNTALALHDLGRNRESLDCLDRLLSLQPDLAEAQLNRGRVLLELGRPGEALEAFQGALTLAPEDSALHLDCGLALAALDRHGEAIACFDRALAAQPRFPEARLQQGVSLQALGRVPEALARYRQALELRPGWDVALLASAAALHLDRRQDEALALLEGLLATCPEHPVGLLDSGILLRELGRPAEALTRLEQLLDLQPDNVEALVNRARALRGLRRPEAALTAFDRALDRRPDHLGAMLDRASALLDLHRPAEALAGLDHALASHPGDPGVLSNRGNAVLTLGDPAGALVDYERALAASPGHPDALLNRGTALLELQRPEEALASFDLALAQRPDWAEAHMNRGTALVALRRMDAALESYDRALALQPQHVEVLVNRGTALHRMGRHRDAVASYDAALTLEPTHRKAHSNRIFVLDYLPEVDCAGHQLARRDCCRALGFDAVVPRWSASLDRDPGRPLRVGYVSADFKRHSAASCFGPVLFHHDRSVVQVLCYSGTTLEDDWTTRFRAASDHWLATAGLSDTALAERIRADRVDILVDLSGHSEGNRLGMFAHRAAPIQITAWGHGGGTGLAAMDVQFTDPVAIPAEVRKHFAETSVDLPCCITFEAPAYAPPVGMAPVLENGWVTFGSLSRFMKASPEVLDLWGRILQQVPDSRLLLKDALLDDPQVQAALRTRFAGYGLAAERLLLRGASSHRDHLAAYQDVDLVLDTFPQNGGITTWEALWMGAPVLALLGGKPPERISAAILHALGLDAWTAASPEDYLARALRAAADPAALAAFRTGIRARILASPAGNPERYTRAVEAAYRALWTGWLAQSDQRERSHG